MAGTASDLMTDLIAHVKACAIARGVAAAEAELIAHAVAVAIAHAWGGTAPYIPRRLALSVRDQAIADAFKGDNYRDLAQQHGISERWVRLIIARAKLTEIENRHADLPG